MKTELTSNQAAKRLLINKSGCNRYQEPDCVDHLLRYISRQNGSPKDDLICCGAIGATDFTDISTTIQQFKYIHNCYERNSTFGRYMDHEIYSFSPSIESILEKDVNFTAELARKLAMDFYDNQFQVYYGVHKKDDNASTMHIHFTTNTVSFRTKKKRHENYAATKAREERLNKIINESLQNYLSDTKNSAEKIPDR